MLLIIILHLCADENRTVIRRVVMAYGFIANKYNFSKVNNSSDTRERWGLRLNAGEKLN